MDIDDIVRELEKAGTQGGVFFWPVVVDSGDGEVPRRVERVQWDDDAQVVVLVLA